MSAPDYTALRKKEHDLNYKIYLLSATSLSNFETYLHNKPGLPVFIEKNNLTGRYELIGLGDTSYDATKELLKTVKANGFEDASILAYYQNQRLSNSSLAKWSTKYPDLIKYINRSE